MAFDDRVLKVAFVGAATAALAILVLAVCGPATLRPTMTGAEFLILLMALGALLGSRRIWLLISLVNNLALLLFFKYARFLVANLNASLAAVHLPLTLADPVHADAIRIRVSAAGGDLLFHLPIAELHH